MGPIKKQLKAVEDVSKRLAALSAYRGIPDNVVQRLHEEAQSLQWAYNELRDIHFTRVIAVYGHVEYLGRMLGVEPIAHEGNMGAIVLFDVPQEQIQKMRSILVPVNWEGNKLADEQIPTFALCERYFATSDDKDEFKRAIWFDLLVGKQWLAEYGIVSAASVEGGIIPWMVSVYRALDWSKAKKIE